MAPMARSAEVEETMATWTRTCRVEAESPGSFFSEESFHDVPARTIAAALVVLPSSAFRFRFFDALVATVDVEGEPQTVRKTENHSEWHYLGGTLYTAEQLQEKAGGSDRFEILLSNMRANRWERVIHTPKGNWHPWEPGFVYVAPSGEIMET